MSETGNKKKKRHFIYVGHGNQYHIELALSLLMLRYLAQPFNVIKLQLKFNPAA
jgi:hypothetical protein